MIPQPGNPLYRSRVAPDRQSLDFDSNQKLASVGGFLRRILCDGTGSGVDVDIESPVIHEGDELVSVVSYTSAAAITTADERTDEYEIKSGGLTKAGGTNETGNLLDIWYVDLAR